MKNWITLLLLSMSMGLSAQPLDSLLEIAASNNPQLKAEYKKFEAALEKIPQAGSLPDPNISFGVFISPIETRVGPQRARLSLTQMFPWFGTLKARKDVRALQAEATFQDFLEAKNQLFQRVSEAYFPLYETLRWQQIEQENIEWLNAYKNITRSKFENNEGSMVDVLRVNILLKDAQTSLTILQKKYDPQLAVLNRLLNQDESIQVDIPDTLTTHGHSLPKDSIFSNNPSLAAIDLRMQASQQQELLAQKQGLPKIGLGLDYMVTGERTDSSVPDNGKDAVMPMITLGIPIFRQKYQAGQNEARLMRESYAQQKAARANELASTFEMATFELDRQQTLIKLYSAQTNETRQILKLLLTTYGNSGKDFEELLRVHQQLLKYQKKQASALVAYHLAVAKLNYLTANY